MRLGAVDRELANALLRLGFRGGRCADVSHSLVNAGEDRLWRMSLIKRGIF
jgi:hypothetical protein